MRGAMPPFPQYVFMAWCSVKAEGQLNLLLPLLLLLLLLLLLIIIIIIIMPTKRELKSMKASHWSNHNKVTCLSIYRTVYYRVTFL
jgi:hypothetical protein